MGIEALPDDQAGEIIAKREAFGRLVLQLFGVLADGERMIGEMAKEQGCSPDDFAIAEASMVFEYEGKDYRISLKADDGERDPDEEEVDG